MTTAATLEVRSVPSDELASVVGRAVAEGRRFAGLVAFATVDGSTRLRAVLATGRALEVVLASVPAGGASYPAVTVAVPAAFWYEREIHDLYGLAPADHPRLDPLVLPLAAGPTGHRARPGRPDQALPVRLDTAGLPGHVRGEGAFTIPYGPVRSGVFEAVEFVVETFGEDIPHMRVRPYPKHRGIARRFADLDVDDGVLLAERAEGVMSVAHASAYCQAVENAAGVEPPHCAELVRALHAELERVANHLDSSIRQTEGAGQAVAYARLSFHKERVLRLQAQLSGHRFARGVVVPGGVAGPPRLDIDQVGVGLDSIEKGLVADLELLLETPSFLDRLRGTGVIPPELAAAHGALGPIGRGSGAGDDVRITRPYGAYRRLGFEPVDTNSNGDALARQRVRVDEIRTSFHLLRQIVDELVDEPPGPWRVPLPPPERFGLGWTESPQGELIYLVDVGDDGTFQVKPRTASFHNFALFTSAFGGDIFTDFVFIEASFAASIAGVAG